MASNSPKRIRVPLNGVLLLDKSVGWSSNDALIKAKHLMNAAKAGHTGTLDPFATGVLPLCFGEATKFAQDLLDADKTYETVIHLGLTTATGDTEGEVLETREVDVTREQIDVVLAQFRGALKQVPPMYSALKRDGKPLYEYARAGITLEREARDVTIHLLEFIDYQAPFLSVRVMCSKGTYIRVLGEDIGAALGCGAHLNALRRTKVGHLTLTGCLTLETLTATPEEERAALLASVDSLLLTFPEVVLPELLAQRFLQGQRLTLVKEGVPLPSGIGRVRVYRESASSGQADAEIPRQLLGTAQLHDYGVLAPERLVSTAI
ncbi:tRNA pseudouridine(55) synthase TruB [Glaciimonas immobilis]|uniref:tRNA pseudouridine synthase B n=1 Tax=Glaciimonas immobilis TaxID=728004 RepID=A0A840S247_9BURK|nr:tRNA pseudouridine(55) synthase TruB [Glaciimonas immobilis]KAF3996181.1 tRNA pseudouridine(55) synthase TruB [Glaciimonas immobilis]MBB5202670.1 tRNA pseudouridine55 synthase [Glaciimonas immobilis]